MFRTKPRQLMCGPVLTFLADSGPATPRQIAERFRVPERDAYGVLAICNHQGLTARAHGPFGTDARWGCTPAGIDTALARAYATGGV